MGGRSVEYEADSDECIGSASPSEYAYHAREDELENGNFSNPKPDILRCQ